MSLPETVLYSNRVSKARVIGIVDYSPLWKTMAQRHVTQYQLLKAGIDNKTLDSLKKGKNITMLTLEKLCMAVDCTPNDVVTFRGGAKPQDEPQE